MAGETNQSSTPETEVMQFDDSDAVGADNSSSETTAPETSKETVETEGAKPASDGKPDEEPFLDIKYNGAEEHLTKEEAVTLAQKGRNYDKIMEKYNSLANSPALKIINEQAKRANMSVDDYVSRLQEFQRKSDQNRIAQKFREDHPDADDDVVDAYAEQAYQNQLAQEKQQEEKQAADAQKNLEETAKRMLDAFVQEYPDVDVTNLPEEVKVDIDQNGMSLLDAYRAYDLKLTKQALAAERQNKSNRATATGALSDNKGSVESNDPFIQGLLG